MEKLRVLDLIKVKGGESEGSPMGKASRVFGDKGQSRFSFHEIIGDLHPLMCLLFYKLVS